MSPMIESLTLKDPNLVHKLNKRTQLETEQKQLAGIKKQLQKILLHK
jgi:hypothetical protein